MDDPGKMKLLLCSRSENLLLLWSVHSPRPSLCLENHPIVTQ